VDVKEMDGIMWAWFEIWGFHGGKDSSRGLLGCDVK